MSKYEILKQGINEFITALVEKHQEDTDEEVPEIYILDNALTKAAKHIEEMINEKN